MYFQNQKLRDMTELSAFVCSANYGRAVQPNVRHFFEFLARSQDHPAVREFGGPETCFAVYKDIKRGEKTRVVEFRTAVVSRLTPDDVVDFLCAKWGPDSAERRALIGGTFFCPRSHTRPKYR